jgi:predicted nucleic acid-binding protein
MAILIDADIVIEAERGTFDLFAWLASRPDEEFKMAAITIAALWHGVERATSVHRDKRQRFLERVSATFEIVPYSERDAFVHARIWSELEASGRMIGAHDMILAAIALECGAAVATFNARHFAVVPGLRVITPL